MEKSRREFLKISAAAGAGLLLSDIDVFAKGKTLHIRNNFGLQLYTLRDVLPADPKGVLQKVASYGYKQIESYGGAEGIFWGMKNTDFKKYVNDLGMDVISSHCNWKENLEPLAAEAGEIGMKYLICPYLGPQASIDDFKKAAQAFNAAGEICRKNGLRFAYHNHAYSFKELEGQIPQEVMMAETDPELVDFELDMYWAVDAGIDVSAFLKKHKGRIKLCHVKDKAKTPIENDANSSCILGQGSINYPSILKTAMRTGVKYYMVEQERYVGTTPLASVEQNAVFMKGLKL